MTNDKPVYIGVALRESLRTVGIVSVGLDADEVLRLAKERAPGMYVHVMDESDSNNDIRRKLIEWFDSLDIPHREHRDILYRIGTELIELSYGRRP